MPIPKPRPEGYSYADYLTWPDEERWELIDGVPYDVSPAPRRRHQRVLLDLARLISDITDKGPCQTYVAPLDVRLPEESTADEEIITVVQPDIVVYCRPERLDERGAVGAPDLAVEILSESTGYKDQTAKLALYERHGVREYWIVNADAGHVMVYRLNGEGKYGKPDYYLRSESAVSEVLGGVKIPVAGFIPD